MKVCGTLLDTFTQFSLMNAFMEASSQFLFEHQMCARPSGGHERTEQAKSLVQGRDGSSETVMDAGSILKNGARYGLNREGWEAARDAR